MIRLLRRSSPQANKEKILQTAIAVPVINVGIFILVISLAFSCSTSKSKYPLVEIETRHGNIIVELYTDKAPLTTAAFLKNVEQKVYENCFSTAY